MYKIRYYDKVGQRFEDFRATWSGAMDLLMQLQDLGYVDVEII